MTLISVLIVISLEYYFRWGAEHRSFSWFSSLQEKLEDQFAEHKFWSGWGGISVILLLPILVMWLFLNIFSGAFYLLVLFIVACLVLFMTIGPKPLKTSLKSYFDAMERGDEEAAYLALQQESALEDVPESEDLIRNATRVILVESQIRYFGIIFWFIFLGPFGALFYRLAQIYHCSCKQNANDEHFQLMSILVHWLDWAPSRLTSLLFLLTGDFVNGFYRVKDYLVDLDANNNQLISETGIAALGIDIGMAASDIQENKDALAMVERTVIIYLVAVAVLSPLAFW
jgi:AmpE protein